MRRSLQFYLPRLLSVRHAHTRASLLSLRGLAFGQPAGKEDIDLMLSARLVVMGEIHEAPPCVELQCRTASAMLSAMEDADTNARLHIVLEHFNFEMQPLLDEFTAGDLSLAGLAEGSADEGHDPHAYAPLLELCRANAGRIALHAGFIPRHYARLVMRESLDVALSSAKAHGYLASDETCAATDAHYNFFESLLTGRDIHNPATRKPTDKYRRMFPAQVIKDAAMAHKLNCLIAASESCADRFLAICGVGHSGYSHGVPERVFSAHPKITMPSTYRIWSLPLAPTVDLDAPASVAAALIDAFGPVGSSSPAELCLAFQEQAEGLAVEGQHAGAVAAAAPTAAEAKAATAEAYEQVGETAAITGDRPRAAAVMTRLGYTAAQIATAGDDAPNFQGVGTPHLLADLQPGEAVLDMGSGLGIDSFIAARRVTECGSVIGIDLAAMQVRHAAARAASRAANHLRFAVGDLERTDLPSESFDVVISNGAFCLVPDKPAAFKEVFRVLRPGGRFAICMSVMKKPLEPGINWPLCMKMFLDARLLGPICVDEGFTDVFIDDSDSAMAFELPEAEGTHDSPTPQSRRNRVHVGSAEFEHLRRVDVNELCARVVVCARKPHRWWT